MCSFPACATGIPPCVCEGQDQFLSPRLPDLSRPRALQFPAESPYPSRRLFQGLEQVQVTQDVKVAQRILDVTTPFVFNIP